MRPMKNGWFPIASAPRDGTAVDLWVEDEMRKEYRLPSATWQPAIDHGGPNAFDWHTAGGSAFSRLPRRPWAIAWRPILGPYE